MKLDKSMKLADLMYGHGEKFMCFLHGNFAPETYPDAPPIQICEMKCGCWVVADGNDRVGLILKDNPEATLADIPKRLIATYRYGKWDEELMDWWNPCAKSFGEVMSQRGKTPPAPKDAIYGMIERNDDEFFAVCMSVKDGASATTATGHTVLEAKVRLENKIKNVLKRKSVSLVLMPMSPLETHHCSPHEQ